jgi:hypothetical protein
MNKQKSEVEKERREIKENEKKKVLRENKKGEKVSNDRDETPQIIKTNLHIHRQLHPQAVSHRDHMTCK